MLVGIHQLHYLPWLRYFEKIARSDCFVVLDNIQFNKNGWQNRNKIKSAPGAALLTVPVLGVMGQTLDEVRINNNVNWRKKHWRTIQQCYGMAPFFAKYEGFLADAYAREWRFLNEVNDHMLAFFVEALGIRTPLRYASKLGAPGIATERLVNLIKAVGGDRYYTGAFAIDAYLDASLLESSGIAIETQEWHAPAYPQLHGEFVPDLSILDLLMNRGDDSLGVIMGDEA